MKLARTFLPALASHILATAAHFWHNSAMLAQYPNLPAWITRNTVGATWMLMFIVVLLGLRFTLTTRPRRGLVMIGLVALMGLSGLAHYAAAPMSGHTAVMNATIIVEAATGTWLLICVALTWRGAGASTPEPA